MTIKSTKHIKSTKPKLTAAQKTTIITALISAIAGICIAVLPILKDLLKNDNLDEAVNNKEVEAIQTKIAQKVSRAIIAKHYDEVNDDFSHPLKISLTTDVIKSVSDSVLSNLGEFKSVAAIDRDKEPFSKLDRVIVTNNFTNKSFYVTVLFTKENEIYGLWVNSK